MDKPPDRPTRVDRRIASPEHRAAYQAARDAPTEHKPKLITSRSVAPTVHGGGTVGRFNSWLAVTITRSVGTMWAAYVFTFIGVGGLVGAVTGNTTLALIFGSISSYLLQLVLLPVIMVGQNVISASQDARAEADHLTLTTLHAINVQQLEIIKQSRELLRRQQEILDTLEKNSLPAAPTGK